MARVFDIFRKLQLINCFAFGQILLCACSLYGDWILIESVAIRAIPVIESNRNMVSK